jgi:hypothetical protein
MDQRRYDERIARQLHVDDPLLLRVQEKDVNDRQRVGRPIRRRTD